MLCSCRKVTWCMKRLVTKKRGNTEHGLLKLISIVINIVCNSFCAIMWSCQLLVQLCIICILYQYMFKPTSVCTSHYSSRLPYDTLTCILYMFVVYHLCFHLFSHKIQKCQRNWKGLFFVIFILFFQLTLSYHNK